MKKFILASGSPRRKEILLREGYSFEIVTSDKEDAFDKNCPAEKFSVRCALSKARDVYSRVPKTSVVLGADTVVAFEGKIYGKPASEEEAGSMLKAFSGKTHTVFTAYVLIRDGMRMSGVVETKVTFNDLSDDLISEYLKSGLYKGKAGAYGIQDGFPLVKSYDGDYDNVMGLPIGEIYDNLKEFLK